MVKFSTPG